MRNSYSSLCLGLATLLALGACDSAVDAPAPGALDNATTVQINDGESRTELTLVDGTPAGHTAFGSRDALQEHLDTSENATRLVVNRQVWETVKHALPATTAAVLDANGSVQVGDLTYTATRDGVYSRPSGEPTAAPTTDLYYGEQGDAEAVELGLVVANSGIPEALRALELRNPHLAAKAEAIADAGGIIDTSEGAAKTGNECGAPFFWESCSFLYAPYNAVYVNGTRYSIRFMNYNESSGSLWYKKATAGSQPAVQLANGTWAAVGYESPYTIGEYIGMNVQVWGRGNYSGTGDYTSSTSCQGRPYVDVPPYQVQISCWYSISTQSKRKGGRSASSQHDVRAGYWTAQRKMT